MQSPVKEVTFGESMQITLDHYYDLLKARAGDIDDEQYLQLSLTSSVLDLAAENIVASDGGYHWHSKYNLVRRVDKSISPKEVDGEIITTLEPFTDTYEEFLDQLTTYAVIRDLSPDEQADLAALKLIIRDKKRELGELQKLDRSDWEDYAVVNGLNVADRDEWYQWSKYNGGFFDEMYDVKKSIRRDLFRKRTLLDREYGDIDDKRIADAAITFDDSFFGYPIHPDSLYENGDKFNPTYLATSISETDALFHRRPVVAFSPIFSTIIGLSAGAFDATMSRDTGESRSITTDWSAGGSVSYGFIRVRANASEHRSIQDDFKKATSLRIAANAVFPIDMNFPWLDVTLFENKRVIENLDDFEEFFGDNGRLKYYPAKVICLRGMLAEFTSSQKWKYDYVKSFRASGGGGFGVFGISFGASASYSRHVEEHKIDNADTKLTFSDGEGTLRFAGFIVQKNTVWERNKEAFVGKAKMFDDA